jgi:hypothetical protein
MMLEEMLLNTGENSVSSFNMKVNIIISDTRNIFNHQFSTYSLIHMCMYVQRSSNWKECDEILSGFCISSP